MVMMPKCGVTKHPPPCKIHLPFKIKTQQDKALQYYDSVVISLVIAP